MSAQDNLNPHQLQMFMTPREIGGYVKEYGDFGQNPGGLPHEAMHALNDEYDTAGAKEFNLGDSGMGESVRQQGVKKPVDISYDRSGRSYLANGHHRVMAQSMHDPDRPIPVVHNSRHDNQYWGRGNEGLAYRAFNMNGDQQEDPTGDTR